VYVEDPGVEVEDVDVDVVGAGAAADGAEDVDAVSADVVPYKYAGNCRSNLTTGLAFFSCMSSCVGPMYWGLVPPRIENISVSLSDG
jgi:hypothetical protein